MGPNLDVIEAVNNEAASRWGSMPLAGPFGWEKWKSLRHGLHTDSNNRMLVVAQNFPGTGNSDRSPDREVSTVRKSLDQLTQVELVPYFSVTTPSFGSWMRGRHDDFAQRYQGFPGNIRASTRPISFDSNAIQQVFSLPEFASWREAGRLLISENSAAVPSGVSLIQTM